MSELETSLRELREDLRSSITRPGLDKVAGRARQRAVRRRMQVGAITAVMLVSAAVPILRSLPVEDGKPAGLPTVARPVEYEVDFADARHGFALGRDCAEPAGPCLFTLLATTDRGRTWRARELPGDSAPYKTGSMMVIDANRLLIYLVPPREDSAVELAISRDGGRTWAKRSTGLGPPRAIPAGAPLQQVCTGARNGDCVEGVGTVNDDGTLSPAPAQPPLTELSPGGAPTAGGRYWVAGQDPATKRWGIAVTSDRGATWTTNLVDLPGELWLPGSPWSVVEGGGVLYATALGSVGVGPLGLLAVFRSTDGGGSWTQTWRASKTTVLMAVDGSPVVTSDGRLVLYSTTEGTLQSTDGGRHFSRADHTLLGPVMWTRAGYLAKGEDNRYELSSNGVDWQAFTIRR